MRSFFFTILIVLVFFSCKSDRNPPIKEFKQDLNTLPLKYAKWFDVKYLNNYKKITVINPWTKEIYWEYHLYKENIKYNAKNLLSELSSPTKSIVLSVTQIGMFNKLSILDQVVSVSNVNYIYNPTIRTAVKQGEINELGDGASLNIEKAYASQADIIFSTAWDKINPKLLKLINLNIPVAFVMDWQEETPLARAEWIKFVAAFYDKEEQACKIFDSIEHRYLNLIKLGKKSSYKPSVLHGIPISGTWYVAGGKSFISTFYTDANVNYLWKDDSTTGSIPLGFEAVFFKARQADYWINSTLYTNNKDLLNEDKRYALFESFLQKNIYSNGGKIKDKYPSPFWEEGAVNPDQVLKDLICIFHHDLLPNYKLKYYRKLDN